MGAVHWTAPTSALTCQHIDVSFGPVHAVNDVCVAFAPRLIHAVVGQNGAGKSTLAKAISGVITPDRGRVLIGDSDVTGLGVRGVRSHGLEIVHQHLALPPTLSVLESLELFAPNPHHIYSRRQLERKWKNRLEALGMSLPLRAKIRDIPIEVAQSVEIARALASDPSILLLDEPTAVLTPAAIESLFAQLRDLRNRGYTVVIVLHKLREVRDIADTVTVLRDGRTVAVCVPNGAISAGDLTTLIVGSSQTPDTKRLEPRDDSSPVERGRPVATLAGVTTQSRGDEIGLRSVDLELRNGEIVGVAGVEGNGQRALVHLLAGLEGPVAGAIEMFGADATKLSIRARRRLGLRVIPFDRNVEGVSLTASLWRNVAVKDVVLGPRQRRLLLRPSVLREHARRLLLEWNVRFRSDEQPVRELSGGNVQRLIFARELSGGVKLLLAAQPARGLDVSATQFVFETLNDLRQAGTSILLISSDLDELLEHSNRICVILRGEITASFERPFDLAAIGRAMLGASGVHR